MAAFSFSARVDVALGGSTRLAFAPSRLPPSRCAKRAASSRRGRGARLAVECAATAASNIVDFEEKRHDGLPEPPTTATVMTVLPYLMKVAFTRNTNYWRVVAAAGFVILAKVSGLCSPYFLKVAVEKLGMGSAFVVHCIANILLFGLCRVVSGLASDIQYSVFAPVAQEAGRKITSSVFRHVLDLDIEYHLNRRSGSISTIIERGARSIQFLFRGIFFRFLPTALELLFVSAIFGHIFTPLVSGILLISAFGFIGYSVYIIKISVESRKKMIELENRQSGKAVDVLQNLETVTLFNNQYLEAHQYHGLLEDYQQASLTHERVMALLNSGQTFIITVGLTMSLALTIVAGPGGRILTPGDLILMQGMIMQLWAPLSVFGWFYRETRQSLTDMQEFLNILKTEGSIKDGHLNFNKLHQVCHTDGVKVNGSSSRHKCSEHGIDLKFNNVTFGYTPDRTVLKGVTFDVPAGTSVALVGSSGSGKSTCLSLLARLYDVYSGSVKFDGYDIRDITTSSLRSVVGVVPQDTVLFNDTLYANILYGKPTATPEEVYEAARMAQLDKAICRLPDGYDTMVGERGLKLSGGEKQRVAIARTFLRSPMLLVCDEATSALDTATEQDIMASLTMLAKGRTSVFVAHRLSTIQGCDKIIVMSDGQVIEQGTHAELMRLRGTYFDMWESQAERDNESAEREGTLRV